MTQPPTWWQPPGPQGHPHTGPQHVQQHAQPQQPNYGGSLSSQYGGLGAFEQSPRSKPARSRKPLVIGLVVVVLLAGGGVAAWLLGAFRDDVLDQESLQNGVATVLRDSYGEHDVRAVSCPADQEIRAGHTFECTVDIGDRRAGVPIRVLNDKPEYEVGAPR
ncbi:DUF4333 domain-containing protein [Prauserella oleivorans]|uniref:DUF4333 domain-containing protein n=1 Tax=Prauserella oleivorans TaxID=1478153 RepID=A0ABW5W3T7_9PSEU